MCPAQDAALLPARLAVTHRMPQGSKPDEEDATFFLFGNEATFFKIEAFFNLLRCFAHWAVTHTVERKEDCN